MKAALVYQQKNPSVPLPNAATPQQVLHRMVDMLLMAAAGAGFGAMILLMLALA